VIDRDWDIARPMFSIDLQVVALRNSTLFSQITFLVLLRLVDVLERLVGVLNHRCHSLKM